MSHFLTLKNVTKTVSNSFPRVNKPHFLETSIESTYVDTFFPINSWELDKFIEFRIPKSAQNFIDLSNIHIQFQLQIAKKTCDSNGVWSSNTKTGSGDHFDLINVTLYSIFKGLSIEINNVQLVNINNYSLNTSLRIITQFSTDEF